MIVIYRFDENNIFTAEGTSTLDPIDGKPIVPYGSTIMPVNEPKEGKMRVFDVELGDWAYLPDIRGTYYDLDTSELFYYGGGEMPPNLTDKPPSSEFDEWDSGKEEWVLNVSKLKDRFKKEFAESLDGYLGEVYTKSVSTSEMHKTKYRVSIAYRDAGFPKEAPTDVHYSLDDEAKLHGVTPKELAVTIISKAEALYKIGAFVELKRIEMGKFLDLGDNPIYVDFVEHKDRLLAEVEAVILELTGG